MAFRRYGGLDYASTHNMVKSLYGTSSTASVTQQVGQPDSTIVVESNLYLKENLDISGNLAIPGYPDVESTLDYLIGLGTGPTGPPGPTGPIGPVGPVGPIGPTGTSLLGVTGNTIYLESDPISPGASISESNPYSNGLSTNWVYYNYTPTTTTSYYFTYNVDTITAYYLVVGPGGNGGGGGYGTVYDPAGNPVSSGAYYGGGGGAGGAVLTGSFTVVKGATYIITVGVNGTASSIIGPGVSIIAPAGSNANGNFGGNIGINGGMGGWAANGSVYGPPPTPGLSDITITMADGLTNNIKKLSGGGGAGGRPLVSYGYNGSSGGGGGGGGSGGTTVPPGVGGAGSNGSNGTTAVQYSTPGNGGSAFNFSTGGIGGGGGGAGYYNGNSGAIGTGGPGAVMIYFTPPANFVINCDTTINGNLQMNGNLQLDGTGVARVGTTANYLFPTFPSLSSSLMPSFEFIQYRLQQDGSTNFNPIKLTIPLSQNFTNTTNYAVFPSIYYGYIYSSGPYYTLDDAAANLKGNIIIYDITSSNFKMILRREGTGDWLNIDFLFLVVYNASGTDYAKSWT